MLSSTDAITVVVCDSLASRLIEISRVSVGRCRYWNYLVQRTMDSGIELLPLLYRWPGVVGLGDNDSQGLFPRRLPMQTDIVRIGSMRQT
jgi:hypothetical protein